MHRYPALYAIYIYTLDGVSGSACETLERCQNKQRCGRDMVPTYYNIDSNGTPENVSAGPRLGEHLLRRCRADTNRSTAEQNVAGSIPARGGHISMHTKELSF